MSNYTKIAADTFQKLQLNAGVICTEFDPANPAEIPDEKILFATSGGANFTAVPTYTDYGEDIDNCPTNMMELKRLDSWEVKLAGTALTVDTASAKFLTGAADVSGNSVKPRNQVDTSDFTELWWVGEYGDSGCLAIRLLNALSTGGFNLQTGNKAKGTFEFELTGHYSMDAQDTPPFEIHVLSATSSVSTASSTKTTSTSTKASE